ncbi:MAG TPA: hypothetical protein VHA12_01030 [Candidatus Nanoarchaeia archaeon]|nr:hypothetical protein [Candidatus Nanoarchaeia archaeon]
MKTDLIRENYVDFFLEFKNPDKFKKILWEYGKNKNDKKLKKEIYKNFVYFRKCLNLICSLFKLNNFNIKTSGKESTDSNLISDIIYRIKESETIWKKTLRYEAGKLKFPPRSAHQKFKRYPFYDIYGIKIVVKKKSDISKIIVPNLLTKFKEVLERKDYIKYPHENGYQGLHLFLSLKKKKSFSPVLEIQIQDKKMYESSLKLDYHKEKYVKKDDYFSRRYGRVKTTEID